MVVSIPLFTNMLAKSITPNEVREVLKEHYSGSEFVKVREAGYSESMIGANNFEGRDDMEIELNGNADRFVITSRFDNLGKGASGAAIECMNIACKIKDDKSLNIGE